MRDYTDDQLAVLESLASEARDFFDFEKWADDPEDDAERDLFDDTVRDWLEGERDGGAWVGHRELDSFNERQEAAGLSNRSVVIARWGYGAYEEGDLTEEDRHLIERLNARR
jgi:hypothetical protein